MGDRAWAKLVIGGPVSRETLAELVRNEGYDLDEAEESDDGHEGLYLERRGGGHVLVLKHGDQLGAMWGGFEAALVEAGIAFDRLSNGYAGSWSDSIAAWRPGMPEVYEAVADANQQRTPTAASARSGRRSRGPRRSTTSASGSPAPTPTSLRWSRSPGSPGRPTWRPAMRDLGEGRHRCPSTA